MTDVKTVNSVVEKFREKYGAGDVLTKEKLDNERDIVKNERRQGLEKPALRAAGTC